MGFFKDIHTLTKQAKEIDKTFDPGAQARDATARMAAMNQQFSQANAALAAPPEDAVEAIAQIVSVGTTTGMINMDPIVPVELLVLEPGRPPRPVSLSAVVPMTQLAQLQPGATVPVRVSRSDPAAVAVVWR
jgi:hypothetical protein